MAKEATIAREGGVNGLQTRNAVSSVPESEREALQGWLRMIDRAETEERVTGIGRTAEAIFNNGEVSYASAKAVIDAARKRASEMRNKK